MQMVIELGLDRIARTARPEAGFVRHVLRERIAALGMQPADEDA